MLKIPSASESCIDCSLMASSTFLWSPHQNWSDTSAKTAKRLLEETEFSLRICCLGYFPPLCRIARLFSNGDRRCLRNGTRYTHILCRLFDCMEKGSFAAYPIWRENKNTLGSKSCRTSFDSSASGSPRRSSIFSLPKYATTRLKSKGASKWQAFWHSYSEANANRAHLSNFEYFYNFF